MAGFLSPLQILAILFVLLLLLIYSASHGSFSVYYHFLFKRNAGKNVGKMELLILERIFAKRCDIIAD